MKEKLNWRKSEKILFYIISLSSIASIIMFLLGEHYIPILLLATTLIFSIGYLFGIAIGIKITEEATTEVLDKKFEKFISLLEKELNNFSEDCLKEIVILIEKYKKRHKQKAQDKNYFGTTIQTNRYRFNRCKDAKSMHSKSISKVISLNVEKTL